MFKLEAKCESLFSGESFPYCADVATASNRSKHVLQNDTNSRGGVLGGLQSGLSTFIFENTRVFTECYPGISWAMLNT